MRAVVQDRYGSPEVLRLDEVPTPTPGPDQVLVRVAATSVNLSDWECLHGSPLYARIGGLRSPARPTLGSDIAGTVEAVGGEVTRFAPGDEVFGDNLSLTGGFAEYVVAPESALAIKPAALGLIAASTIPQAGVIALQGLDGVSAGDQVLINGAGGGSGMFAIQLARRYGAHVTGVDNASKLDHMRRMGADEVVDHASDDFARGREPYDLVLDMVAHRSVFAYRRSLAPGGRYRCVGGPVRTLLRIVTVGSLVARVTGRRMGMLAVKQGPPWFEPVTEMCVAGDLAIHVDRTFMVGERGHTGVVRTQYHLRRRDAGFDAWDVERLIELSAALPVEEVPLDEIVELDEPYWFHELEAATVRSVVDHVRLISEADTSYPVVLDPDGRVMDGMHRIARAMLDGRPSIAAVRLPELPEPDVRNCHPDDLPYDR